MTENDIFYIPMLRPWESEMPITEPGNEKLVGGGGRCLVGGAHPTIKLRNLRGASWAVVGGAHPTIKLRNLRGASWAVPTLGLN